MAGEIADANATAQGQWHPLFYAAGFRNGKLTVQQAAARYFVVAFAAFATALQSDRGSTGSSRGRRS